MVDGEESLAERLSRSPHATVQNDHGSTEQIYDVRNGEIEDVDVRDRAHLSAT